MRSLMYVFFKPRVLAETLKTNPKWTISFFILAGVSILLMILMHPYVVEMTLNHLPSSATAHNKQVVAEMLSGELGVRCAFLPVRLLVGWVSFALALFFVCKSWKTFEPVRFVHLLALEVHAESILVVANLGGIMHQFMKGNSNEYAVPFGLDMIVHSENAAMGTFLNSINIFSLWYVIILTVGVAVLYKFHIVKALVCVLVTWGLSILFNVGVMVLLGEVLHF